MNAIMGSTFLWTQPAGAAAPPAGGEGTATQGAPEGPGGSGQPMGPCGNQSPATTIIMMLAMFAVFYFLLIRPQQKKAKEHQAMLDAVQKGDEVVTNGGLIGRVTGVADKVMTIEVSEKVRVRVLRNQIAGKHQAGAEKK